MRRPADEPGAVTPFGVTIAITAIGSILSLESAIGISGGHGDIRALIEWRVDQLEPRPMAPDSND